MAASSVGEPDSSDRLPRVLRKRIVQRCARPNGLRHPQGWKQLPTPRASLFDMVPFSAWSRPVNRALTWGYC